MSKFGTRIKVQKRSGKNFILVFSIEFYDFWRKPHLNKIKRRKVTAFKEIQISHQTTIFGQTKGYFKREKNECIGTGERYPGCQRLF